MEEEALKNTLSPWSLMKRSSEQAQKYNRSWSHSSYLRKGKTDCFLRSWKLVLLCTYFRRDTITGEGNWHTKFEKIPVTKYKAIHQLKATGLTWQCGNCSDRALPPPSPQIHPNLTATFLLWSLHKFLIISL